MLVERVDQEASDNLNMVLVLWPREQPLTYTASFVTVCTCLFFTEVGLLSLVLQAISLLLSALFLQFEMPVGID